MISTLSEMLAAALAALLIDVRGLGRKNSMILFFALESVCCLFAVGDDKSRFVLWALAAKFFLAMTFIFAYQFTGEVYPTKIRTTGIGTA
jgi:hypothetical protein